MVKHFLFLPSVLKKKIMSKFGILRIFLDPNKERILVNIVTL